MAKVLVLSTVDEKHAGLAWSTSEKLRDRGHEVCFISMDKRYESTSNYFYDIRTRRTRLKPISFIHHSLDKFIIKYILKPINKYSFMSSYLFGIAAHKILDKCPFNPDYIVVSWVANFITPRTVSKLHQKTGARIIFPMVDEAILSTCHYPCNCQQFTTGCSNCPAIKRLKWLPRYIHKQKLKYWSSLPADIIGTSFDLELVRKTPFLRHMNLHKTCSYPRNIPIFSRSESRNYFKIPKEDFVIFAGANNVKDERKGFIYLKEALHEFIRLKKNKLKRITLLLIGNGLSDSDFDYGENINVLIKDFLPKSHFFKAYYACDVYISPTIADSGPMMVNFAIACGRPVICFPIGVALDLVVPGKTGYIARITDSKDIAEGIEMFYNMDMSQMLVIEKNCKKHIRSFEKLDPYGEIIS